MLQSFHRRALILLLIGASCVAGQLLSAQQRGPTLICCGGNEVFVLPANVVKQPEVSDRTWRWRAADSPEIPESAHAWFRSTDECKPFADSILITSSSGGVALVRRRDRRCLFYAFAKNAHSACMVPKQRIAVASSFGGDELLLYRVGEVTEQSEPTTKIALKGAHGVVWDAERHRLWALGSDELLLLEIVEEGNKVKFVTRKSWPLPSAGGHDLAQTSDPQRLYVTTNEHVYQFDKQRGSFSPDRALGNHKKVKSVTVHPATGEVVYHQATDKNWWSDTIRFVSDREDLRLPNERLYKVRWDTAPAQTAHGGAALDNGIELPHEWPPRMTTLPERLPVPPYLVAPPNVIPIDVGRQLFVDDFLIEHTDMTRRFHKAVYHPANPVLTYDKPWEMSEAHGGLPTACPYSGGVWYDPAKKKFRMWYMGGYIEHLCLAESEDGIRWTKPKLDVRSGTNIVLWKGATESNSLLMDLNESDPARRFKYFMTNIGKGWKTEYRHSPDGIHWSEPVWYSGPHGDRTTVFYNPFRKRWVFAPRTADRSGLRQGRAKKYWETADINDGSTVQWPASDSGRFEADAPLWVSADLGLDKPRVEVGIAPQLYHLDCVAYESLMVGMFNILRGDFHENDGEGRDAYPGRPKCAEICVGFSRDGFHWQRPTHETFAGISEHAGDWNWGNVQSSGNSFLVVGDHLYFYVSGRKGAGGNTAKKSDLLHPAYAGCSTGLAVLRRDGFASMEAGDAARTLTTRKLRFSGSRLFVNIDAPQGELRVEVLDSDGKVIAPLIRDRCDAIRVNKTLQPITWKGSADLSHLAGRTVRFRFHLTNGRLYSFWVSPEESGASRGYVAGGGPGFSEHRDTAGVATNGEIVADYKPLFPVAEIDTAVAPRNRGVPPRDGLVMWLKADSIEAAEDGSPVATWRDSSNNKMDGAQDDASRRPRWIKNAIGQRPALRFDGVDDHLLLDHYPGLFHTYFKSTVFAVVRPSDGGAIISQAHANLSITRGESSRLAYSSAYMAAGGDYNWPQLQTTKSNPLTADRPAICTLVHSGNGPGETSLRINGQRGDDGSAFPYHKTSPIAAYVGCGYQRRYPWKGDIGEIIVYGRALSESERNAVESYLAAKYAIETSSEGPTR